MADDSILGLNISLFLLFCHTCKFIFKYIFLSKASKLFLIDYSSYVSHFFRDSYAAGFSLDIVAFWCAFIISKFCITYRENVYVNVTSSSIKIILAYCSKNCSDLSLWENIVLVIEKNFCKLRPKAENHQIFLDQ